ncbi:MOSC domain-containing protein [Alphaproteobacteria bacterium]|mgnify:FL=1|nr:MOSC domain-containing protein [Alphaproteobacteria bacterium]
MPKIKAINITNLSGESTIYVNQAILERNKGIINDRYYENFKKKYEQVTLIESEKISNFNNNIKSKFNYKDFRRNIITTGIDLNKMINKKIQINNVVLKIHQLCQPCRYLQNKLSVDNLVKLLTNKGGVRAEIVQSGIISTFDEIKIIK